MRTVEEHLLRSFDYFIQEKTEKTEKIEKNVGQVLKFAGEYMRKVSDLVEKEKLHDFVNKKIKNKAKN